MKKRVELRVDENILEIWNQLARIISIDRASLIKVAMSQLIRSYRMLLKEDSKNNLSELEVKLKKLKEFDANSLLVLNITSKEEKI